jgi:MFS family permease
MTIMMPLMRSVQSDMIPKQLTAKVFGLQQASFNLGMIVGPVLGAVIYKWLVAHNMDGGLTFVLAGLIGFAGVLAFLTINREELSEAVEG